MKPYDFKASHLPQGILDFSNIQDAPAGKHGFLKTREDGHFYFEDGERVRFIGVNIEGDGGTAEKDIAPVIAERLARNGMNMVRLHHIDSMRGAPKGHSILEYKDDHSKTLNAEGIDKLDYLIYQLKIRGIYTHIDLFTLRTILPGDGLDYPDLLADDFDIALKNIQWYNKRIRELTKIYTEQYLTHYNPYTKTRYVDEPAVAIVQMLNENSIFWDSRKKTRAFPSYRRELNLKWNQYLLDTYHTREELDKAWTNEKGQKALLVNEDPSRFNVLDPGLGYWGELSSEYDAPLAFERSPVRIAEHKKFLSFLADEYITDMMGFLRGLGVKCCIDISNLPLGVAELEIIAKGDITEKNTYWNHPQRDREDKSKPDIYHHQSSYNTSPLPFYEGERFESFLRNMISSNSFGAVTGKPLVITEWNVPHPLPFRSDIVMQMACYGTLQDWDGMLLFQYVMQGTAQDLENDYIFGPFTGAADPGVWGLMALSAVVFRQGLVKVAKNLVEVCYTDVDKFHQPDFMVPYRPIPFISRIRGNFIGTTYSGNADLAVSSGFTASGDYTTAKHSLIYSRSPYGDFYQKSNDLDSFISKHDKNPSSMVLRDGRLVDKDPQEFYRQFRSAYNKFGLGAKTFSLEDDEALVSDTGELVYNYKGGFLSACTEQFNSYTGDGGNHEVGSVCYKIDNPRMCVSLLSRDGKPLEESESILVTAIGDSGNSGYQWDGDKLLSYGHGPIVLDPFRGSVSFKNGAISCEAWALDDRGCRVEELKATKIPGGFKVDCSAKTVTMYYELSLKFDD
jgi:hypothetical protein